MVEGQLDRTYRATALAAGWTLTEEMDSDMSVV